MFNSTKVRVASHNGVKDADERGNARRGHDFASQILINSGTKNARNVVKETVRIAVFYPVVVRIDSAAVFARFLSVRNVLEFGQGRSDFGIPK